MNRLFWQFAIDDHSCDIHGRVLIESIRNAYFDPPLEVTVRFLRGARFIYEDLHVYPATPEGNALLDMGTIHSESDDTASKLAKVDRRHWTKTILLEFRGPVCLSNAHFIIDDRHLVF